MRLVGIISDTPDRLTHAHAVTELLNGLGRELIIRYGDSTSQFAPAEFSRARGSLFRAFGENDGDLKMPLNRTREYGFTLRRGPHVLDASTGRSSSACR